MEKLLEHLRNIWTIFQQAPLEFIILLILAFLAAWYVADFIYKERIETLKQQIDNLKQSIETLKHQLSEYRERLRLDEPDKTAYSQLTNVELQRKAFAVLEQMREMLRQREDQQRRQSDREQLEVVQARTNEERLRLRQEQTQRPSSETPLWMEFDEKLKSVPLLLRNELRSRLPKEYQGESELSYRRVINTGVLSLIIEDLQKMTNSLP